MIAREGHRGSRTRRHRPTFDRLDARELLAATISGTVFQLLNASGLAPQVQAGGFLSAVGDAAVSLDGGAPVLSDPTTGAYAFNDVAPGRHTVSVTPPSGFVGFSGQSLSYSLVIQPEQTAYANLNFALTPTTAALVQNLYEMVLARPATADELNARVASLASRTTVGEVFESLLTSAEFQARSAPIAKLLSAAFPGSPLPIGPLRNAVQLQGLSVDQDATALQLLYSRPFIAKYGDTSRLGDPAFVRFIYQTFLMRSPSPSERSRWVDGLRDGSINRGDVALGLVGTAQFDQRRPAVGPRIGVSLAYLGVLGRLARPSELSQGVARVRAGGSLRELADRLARSAESRALDGFTDTFVWDAKADLLPTSTNDLARLRVYDPATRTFSGAVAPGSLTSSPDRPTNLYVVAHGWAPGFTDDVLLNSTPGRPLFWWEVPRAGGVGATYTPWMFEGEPPISTLGLAQAIVDRDPLAKVVAFSWVDESATPQATTSTTIAIAGSLRRGSAIVRNVDTSRLLPGMTVSSPHVAPGASIRSIDVAAGTITLSRRATATKGADLLTVATARFVQSAKLTSGSAVITNVNTRFLIAGMAVSGAGLPASTVVVSVDSPNRLTLSQAPTQTGPAALRFTGTNIAVLTQTGTIAAGSTTVTATDTSRLALAMEVLGPGIPPGTTIANIDSATQVTLSQPATQDGTVGLIFKGADIDATLKQLLLVGQSEANTQVNGLRLASALRQALAPNFFTFNGSNGAGLVHLLGHSHGSKVATVAALALQQAGVPLAQLTTLESPEAGPRIGTRLLSASAHLANLGGAENFLWHIMRKMRLSRASVLDGRASTDATFVNNYYSYQGVGSALGAFDLSRFDPTAGSLASILDVQLHPELLFGAISTSDIGGVEGTLFGSHDYPPPFFGQTGLQPATAPQVGINWSPLLAPGNVPTTPAFAQPTGITTNGELTSGSTQVTNIDVTGLAVGMPVSDGRYFSLIEAGTTVASVDPINRAITLSLPAKGTGPDSLTFTFTAAQFLANSYDLRPFTRTTVTPAAPVPLAYARQYAMGQVADTGDSLAFTVRPNATTALAAITFNPEPGPGFLGLGAGMDLDVSFSGLRPGDDVRLIVWIRGIAAAPLFLNTTGQGPSKITTGPTIGALSVPLFAMTGAAAGSATQSATLSLGGLLEAFYFDAPFNALNDGSAKTVIPTLGFTVTGQVSAPVTVTVSNMRQFEDGIV